MAVITLGSPSFDPIVLDEAVAQPTNPGSIEVVDGGEMTAMIGEVDPIFSAWDKQTGITIYPSQILSDSADIVPVGLTCSSQGITAGTQSAYVVLTWTAVVSDTFSHYRIRYKRNAFSVYTYNDVYTNTILIEGLVPNTLYNFGVASVNTSSVASAFSTNINVTTSIDTTLPATVADVTATAGIEYVSLSWTANTDADIASYNIYRSTTELGVKALIANINGTYFLDGGLTGGQIQYYWLKAVDTSGNISAAFSIVASATPTVGFTQAELESILGANLADIAVINPVTGYINANTVGTSQIDDDAITAAKVLDGELTAAKLNVAAISATGDLNANTVGTLQIDGKAVTSAQVADDAITAAALAPDSVTGPAIQAGSILAGHITAGEIQAGHIAAGAVTARHITSANFVITDKDDVNLALFTSDSPDPGKVSWVNCVVMYEGIPYSITDGNCGVDDVYIYWEYEATVFSTSETLPTLGNDDFLVATNDGGDHLLAWNSTTINGNRITTGSITATQIGAGEIIASHIDSGTITSDHINASGISAEKLVLTNFLLTAGTIISNATHIVWTDCVIRYSGTTYNITPNNSCLLADKFVYWQLADPTVFKYSSTLPALGNDDFLVAIYIATATPPLIHTWKSTVINGNRITAGSIIATHIAAGAITTNHIGADQITAAHIGAGTIEATNIKAGAITASHLSVEAGATFVAATAGQYTTSASAGVAKLQIFPSADIAIQVLNADTSNVFRVDVGSGATSGDVTIGDYISGQGIWYDNSANKTYFAGAFESEEGTIGTWNIDEDSIYSGTKCDGNGYSAGAGSITIKSDGSIHAENFYIDADGEVSFSATSPVLDGIATKSVNIGDWNMDNTSYVEVTHGVDPTKIRGIDVIICSDVGVGYVVSPLNWADPTTGIVGGRWSLSSIGTVIVLTRVESGVFDNAAYDGTSYNRGWITIQYEI